MKRYKVTLDADECQHLHDLIAAGQAAARKLAHARILLKADAAKGGLAWPDGRIAETLERIGHASRSQLDLADLEMSASHRHGWIFWSDPQRLPKRFDWV